MDKNKLDSLIERYEEVYMIASKKINTMMENQLEIELTKDQFTTLRFLKLFGPCPASELADLCDVNRSAITAMVDRLVTKGYAERIASNKDRRVILIKITEQGEIVLQKGQERVHQFIGSFLHHFEEKEIEEFIRMYEKIAKVLNHKERN
ncbi:MarR family winged helix-turn-helix transcriptional regulator [Chengkuizengella axinellae]|uniref:MarR family transcriptional regulator n=1 Tax=Chengkuizengella axinellae TaxID=3064388 RepID=A0ABT9IYC0_9BACL|nr:MarR family transcriptional regulator [Chengkuizengella sp. 2205SS18-9]MDP5274317.1 MarR family transcriptional regulator [Chengkuizengella sp. 2205SS18-9]